MAVKRQKSYMAKTAEMEPQWRLVDASERPLGRMATEIARVLQGKHRPIYTPHLLTGDFVVVINAAKVRVTGKKMKQKIYYHHSGYPGGLKETPMDRLVKQNPSKIIYLAVKGMLPGSTLGERMLKRLRVYAGSEHPHQGQFAAMRQQPAKAEPEESSSQGATP
ncbi:MAG: 50S ribosomal protein L13 [Dehalococcoidia bacterium]|nr:50S ribosomal protein L13 [Dehalococcoidia bacterium]